MSAVHDPLANAKLTGYWRPGVAARYDECRPRPPAALADVILRLAGTERPALVVDLGSGTGLSTMLWAPCAHEVIGIEPLDEMRRIAEANHRAPNVRFRAGVAQSTGIPSGAADVVTCAQSLHHMEPEGTLTEVERILRPGGIFAAYDYDWPPVVDRDAEEAFSVFMDRVLALRRHHGIGSDQQRWRKEEHIARFERRGFRDIRELLLHRSEPCTAERWVGCALTVHLVAHVLDLGVSDDALGLTAFRRAAEQAFGGRELPWHVSYRVRVAIK
jgi:SAM-dependent methyltransferase